MACRCVMSTGQTLIRAEEGTALSCGRRLKHTNRMLLDKMTLMHHMAPEKFTWGTLTRQWQAASSRDGTLKLILHSGRILELETTMMTDLMSGRVWVLQFSNQ